MVFCTSLCLLVNSFLIKHRSKYSSVVLRIVVKLHISAQLWLSRTILPRQFSGDWRFVAWCRSLSNNAWLTLLIHQDCTPRKHDELTSQGDFVILQTDRCCLVLIMLLCSAHCQVYSRTVILRPCQHTVGRLFVKIFVYQLDEY